MLCSFEVVSGPPRGWRSGGSDGPALKITNSDIERLSTAVGSVLQQQIALKACSRRRVGLPKFLREAEKPLQKTGAAQANFERRTGGVAIGPWPPDPRDANN